jgi:glycosyltransferase involved in cell wall biosynthesis
VGSAAVLHAAILSPGADTGGQGARFVDAARRCAPELRLRSVAGSTNYMHFPPGDRWDYKLIESLFRWADVLHVKTTLSPYKQFDRGRSKPVLLHHHGTAYREAPSRHLDEARHYGALTAVSTIDLLRFAPNESRWSPSPQDCDTLMARRRAEYVPSETVRVLHAPSSRRVKGTALFLEVMADLEQEYNCKAVLVEGKSWREVIGAKAAGADIYYDQLTLGYGQNALEAWAMGVPVVVGAEDYILDEMRRVLGALPFVPTTPETLRERLAALIQSKAQREDEGALGQDYTRQYHDYPAAIATLRNLYDEAIAIKRGGHRYPWENGARRGERRRVGPGQWQVCIRDGMWTGATAQQAKTFEALHALGEVVPVPATGPIAEALR